MSADNGIYVLETDGPEYRVTEMMAVENLWWSRCSKHGGDLHYGNDGRESCDECRQTGSQNATPEMVLENAREMYKGCAVFTDKGSAYLAAADLLETMEVCEYGISPIKLVGKF